MLPSDNVIQSPYHPYTLPFKIKKTKRKELKPWSRGMGKRRPLLYNWSWLCIRPFPSHHQTEVLTWPRSMNSLLLETEQSFFVKESLQTALETAVIEHACGELVALWGGQGTVSGCQVTWQQQILPMSLFYRSVKPSLSVNKKLCCEESKEKAGC